MAEDAAAVVALRLQYLPLRQNWLVNNRIPGGARPSALHLVGDFCNEDRNHPIGLVLVLLIRRVCRDCEFPESIPFD